MQTTIINQNGREFKLEVMDVEQSDGSFRKMAMLKRYDDVLLVLEFSDFLGVINKIDAALLSGGVDHATN